MGKHQKRMSLASEKTAAGKYGKVCPRSGADARQPGDVEWPHLLLEDKITNSDKFYITSRVWDKIDAEAKMRGRIPCVRVTVSTRPPVVALRKQDFDELTRPHTVIDPYSEVERYTRGQSIPLTPRLLSLVEHAEILALEAADEDWVICLWRTFEKFNDNYVEDTRDRRSMEDH